MHTSIEKTYLAEINVQVKVSNKEEAKQLLKYAKNTLGLDWPQIEVTSIWLVKNENVA